MIYETNKVKLQGLVRNKERLKGGTNKVRLSIGKGFRNIITCFVRDDIFNKIEQTKIYEIEGYFVPLDEYNNDLAINLTKVSLTEEYDSSQLVEVVFTIDDFSNIFTNETNEQKGNYFVRDLQVKFKNKNITGVTVDVSLWGKLAKLEGIRKERKAYARCFIATNMENRRIKLMPYAMVLL